AVTFGAQLRVELAVGRAGYHPWNRERAGVGRLDRMLDELEQRSVGTRLGRRRSLEQLEGRLGTDYLPQLGHEALGVFAGQRAPVEHYSRLAGNHVVLVARA